ncbi:MAG: replication-associated recombination protein A [Mariprofundaceae bacterium]
MFEQPAVDSVPLAFRMRPEQLEDIQGQAELTRSGSWFSRSLQAGRAVSCIFWGPPGTGKTTLAMMMGKAARLPFTHLSAVSAGKAEVQDVVRRAKNEGRKSLLFLDEVHRFNKAQQDVLLPYVEDGTLIFIGATTENPSFSLNNALLSRCRVAVLKPLGSAHISAILLRSLNSLQAQHSSFNVDQEAISWLAASADGDARYALNAMESIWQAGNTEQWTLNAVKDHWVKNQARYDRGGDCHYDQISALHKSVRDSDPHAACYWLARMLEAGEEPLYIARRLIRMASEDIGLAEPQALNVCLSAHRMFEILGSPEGEQGLFEAVIYLSLSPKSNAGYMAEKSARKLARQTQDKDVPLHLRNASTSMMKELGYGKAYQYAHNEEDAVVTQSHFPDHMGSPEMYRPTQRGFEQQLAKRLQWLAERRKRKKEAS